MKNLVVIGIPIYKNTLNEFEKISLQQVKNILGHYPITLIAPQSLEFDYGTEYNAFKIVRFPDQYFQSTASYSQLLLSTEFYQCFCDYEFLLIYQLDAFVFSDRLEEFCQLDYDYIGAPWLYWGEGRQCTKSYVGNGGLSLRRINKTINLLKHTKNIKKEEYFNGLFVSNEDTFFAYCGKKRIANFRIAPADIAIKFSIESDTRKAYEKLSYQIPFGCHGWDKLNFDIWKPYIEAYGYQLTGLPVEKPGLVWLEYKKRRVQQYLSKRIIRASKIDRLQFALSKHININKECRIWGAGKDGGRCLALLRRADVPIECIYDSQAQENQFLSGIEIKYPLDSNIQDKRSLIIIATRKYGQEIKEKLERLGLQQKLDFLLFDELDVAIVEDYYAGIKMGR